MLYKSHNLVCVFGHYLKKSILFFFTIQIFFTTIYRFHYIFWYYLLTLLYYFNYLLVLSIGLSTNFFQFQLNKLSQLTNIYLIHELFIICHFYFVKFINSKNDPKFLFYFLLKLFSF